MPKAPRKLTPKSRSDPTAPASPHVSFNSRAELVEYVPGAARLLGIPPSRTPGPLRNLRKYVYHLSQDQVDALREPHDNTPNAENFPWRWSSGVFERLEAGMRAVPRGTVKITIEMPEIYSSIEMPRDLLVRDEAELARIALEGENDDKDDDEDEDDESSGLSSLEDSGSELSELDDEMSGGDHQSESELSEMDEEMFEGWITSTKKETTKRQKEAEKEKEQKAEQEDDYEGDSELTDIDDDEQEDDDEQKNDEE